MYLCMIKYDECMYFDSFRAFYLELIQLQYKCTHATGTWFMELSEKKSKEVNSSRFLVIQIHESIDGVDIECSSPLTEHVTFHRTSQCWIFRIKSV